LICLNARYDRAEQEGSFDKVYPEYWDMEHTGNVETAVGPARQDAAVRSAMAVDALPSGDSPKSGLPALVPAPPRRRRLLTGLALAVALAAAGAGGTYWWLHRLPPLPAGIAFGNGRLEADPIDIATKFAGRIAELRVDEGDLVRAGQALAVMDTRDLAQSLEKAEASVHLQEKAIGEAEANLVQIRTTLRHPGTVRPAAPAARSRTGAGECQRRAAQSGAERPGSGLA
jgi:multidrug resistance efflux pump